MSVVALIASFLFSALKFGSQISARVQANSAAIEDSVVVQAFLQELFEHTEAYVTSGAPAQQPFDGTSDGVEFTTRLPPHASPGGLQRVALFREPGRGGDALVLAWQLERGQPTGSLKASPANRRPLLRGLSDLEFAYFGTGDGGENPDWHGSWRERHILPRLVRLRLKPLSDTRWPEIVASPGAFRLTPVDRFRGAAN